MAPSPALTELLAVQGRLARVLQHVQTVRDDELRRVAEQRAEALRCLELSDYSAAAVACHRAHQHALRAEVLGPVEGLLQ